LNAQKLGISEQFQHYERDTQGLYGPIEVNELGVPLGHKTVGLTKENAATSAKVNGAKKCEPLKNSLKSIMPDRESRHPIISSHWGVSA
jgi:hypothetical protein